MELVSLSPAVTFRTAVIVERENSAPVKGNKSGTGVPEV